jgi:hypothetical protein
VKLSSSMSVWAWHGTGHGLSQDNCIARNDTAPRGDKRASPAAKPCRSGQRAASDTIARRQRSQCVAHHPAMLPPAHNHQAYSAVLSLNHLLARSSHSPPGPHRQAAMKVAKRRETKAMQSRRKLYRLDYYGDDKPEWLSEEMVRLLLENNYGTAAMVAPLLDALKWRCRVHVRAGIIEQVPRGTEEPSDLGT